MLTSVNNDNYYHFKVSQNGPVIGQFALVDEGKNQQIKIVSFGIYGQYRGKGYGQKMLQEAIQEAKKQCGTKAIVLNVKTDNPRAIHIYKKHGFEIAGTSNHGTIHQMVYNLSKLNRLKVKGVKQIEVRQFYDSEWVVEFTNGAWCQVTRYDTDTACEIIEEAEKCRCVAEAAVKLNLKDQIYYD